HRTNQQLAPQRIPPFDTSGSDSPPLSTAMPSVHLAGQEPAQQTCAPSCLLRLKAPTQSPLSPFVAPSNAAAPHSPASNLPTKLPIRLPRPSTQSPHTHPNPHNTHLPPRP